MKIFKFILMIITLTGINLTKIEYGKAGACRMYVCSAARLRQFDHKTIS